MAVGAFGSGSQTTVIGTEHFVADVNEAGVYTFHVDTNAMAIGDMIELRAYQMILTGGTARVEQVMTYQGVQDTPIKKSEPVSNELTDTGALRFSLKQIYGTGRAFPWKVLKHS
jgi:hypothetical protein